MCGKDFLKNRYRRGWSRAVSHHRDIIRCHLMKQPKDLPSSPPSRDVPKRRWRMQKRNAPPSRSRREINQLNRGKIVTSVAEMPSALESESNGSKFAVNGGRAPYKVKDLSLADFGRKEIR